MTNKLEAERPLSPHLQIYRPMLTMMMSIAHRIIVMRRGRISAEFGPDATKEQIMAASGEAVVA